MSLTVLRSSQRKMVNFSQAHGVTGRLRGERVAGQVPDDHPGLLAGRYRPGGAGDDRAGGGGGQVDHLRVAHRGQQPGHDPGGPGEGLGVSSTSIAHTCPAYGLPSMEGQWISASGTCPLRPAAGWSARSRRSLCHQAWPCGPGRAGCIHSRAARIARRCAPAGPARAGWPGTRARWRSCRPGSASTSPAPAPAARWRRTRRGATGPSARAAGPGRPAARRRAGRTGRPSARRPAAARRCPAGTAGCSRHPPAAPGARQGCGVVRVCSCVHLSLPRLQQGPRLPPCIHRCTRCDDCSAPPQAGKGPRRACKRIVTTTFCHTVPGSWTRMSLRSGTSGMPGCSGAACGRGEPRPEPPGQRIGGHAVRYDAEQHGDGDHGDRLAGGRLA